MNEEGAHLSAELAVRTQERDDWLLSFETSNAAMGALEASLTAQAAALEELEQEIRDYGGPNSIMAKWADRLAALRTPEVEK